MSNKLTLPQKQLLESMKPGVWYKDYELPPFNGKTYQALERKGLIRSLRISEYSGRYTPYKWEHEFMRPESGE